MTEHLAVDQLDHAAGDPVERVTPLELFFDLVFVFTITQLTSLLAVRLTWRSMWHVVVMLGLIFWMYDGYAWLTNAVPARGARRQTLLLGGMAGYLVLAIALPDAFSETGLTFGLSYLVITLVHGFLYIRSAGESSSQAMRGLAPWNVAASVFVLVSGAIGGTVQEIVWTLVFLLLWFGTRVDVRFEIGPAHFVERHGLLVIVAIGESVVATGIGAQHVAVDLTLVLVVVLGLFVSAGLWWSYFGDAVAEKVERAFTDAVGPARVRMAFMGFGYAHYVMLIGVVLVAVGLKKAVAHPGDELSVARAFCLAGGVGAFLLAFAWFKSILGLVKVSWRSLLPLVVLLAVPVGTNLSATAGLGALVALQGLVLVGAKRLVQVAGSSGRNRRVAGRD